VGKSDSEESLCIICPAIGKLPLSGIHAITLSFLVGSPDGRDMSQVMYSQVLTIPFPYKQSLNAMLDLTF